MNPHGDYHLLLMRVPSQSATTDPSAATPSAEQARASSAPSADARAVPLTCAWFWGCDEPATDGDMCPRHADKVRDIRREWEDLSAEFEDGWTDGH